MCQTVTVLIPNCLQMFNISRRKKWSLVIKELMGALSLSSQNFWRLGWNKVYCACTDLKICLKGQDSHHACHLKGTVTLMISMFYQKELYEPWILIQVSSKSVEKWASYGHLKSSIWPIFSRHFEYLISFQNFFNCLIFSYHYHHIICVKADMQPYT